MDLKELESGVNPNTHWYYQSKKWPLVRFVKKIFREQKRKVVLVDVGSGSGFFMYELLKLMPEMIDKVWLVDINYSEAEVKDTIGQQVEKTINPPPIIEHAVVVMMDVLEHIEDDLAILNEIKKRCVGKNHFFITVPAFMDLWSGHDVYLGHYRRYTSKTLNVLLANAKISNHKIFYLFAGIFPMVWSIRKLNKKSKETQSNMKPSHPIVNSVLRAYNSFEMNFSRMNKMFGVTCAAEGEITSQQ